MKSCVRLSKMTSSMCHQPEIRRRYFALIFSLSSQLLLSGCSDLPIQVVKEPPRVTVSSSAETSDQSKTEWQFSCEPDFRFNTIRRERIATGEAVVIRVSKIIVRLGLKVDTNLPKNSSAATIEREKGRVAICLDNYGKAQEVAYLAAQPWANKTLQGEGLNFRAAVKKILEVREDIKRQYLEGTADAVTQTSAIYDRLTAESSNSEQFMHAVNDAKIEYNRIRPSLKTNPETLQKTAR